MFFVSDSRNRFKNPVITIGEQEAEVAHTNQDLDAVCAYHQGRPDDVHRFNCTTRMYGRFVRVTMMDHSEALNLYEIEIIGFR